MRRAPLLAEDLVGVGFERCVPLESVLETFEADKSVCGARAGAAVARAKRRRERASGTKRAMAGACRRERASGVEGKYGGGEGWGVGQGQGGGVGQ